MGKVGVAPGTTTLVLGPRGPQLVGAGLGQGYCRALLSRHESGDPGAMQTAVDAGCPWTSTYPTCPRGLRGLGSFDAKPTDFDLSRIYGYTPVRRGWLRGEITPGGLGACCESCAAGGPCASELGETDVSISTVWLSVLVAGGAAAGAAIGGQKSAGWGTAGAAGGALAGLVALSIFNRMGRWLAA